MANEVYQPEGMRDVEQMYQTIASVLSHDPGIHEILNDCETMEDATFEAKYYTSGIASPRYPMPTIQGDVTITPIAIYVADPVGYGCVACWSKQAGKQTI